MLTQITLKSRNVRRKKATNQNEITKEARKQTSKNEKKGTEEIGKLGRKNE
jgi:hypothetical protein